MELDALLSRYTDKINSMEERIAELERSEYGIGSGARVYNSSNISIPTATETALTFNTESFDTGEYHSLVLNPERLTAPVDGFYVIFGGILFASNPTGYRQITIRHNAATAIKSSRIDAVQTSGSRVVVSEVYEMLAGEFVTLRAFQTSGGNLNVLSSNNFSPVFSIWRVG